ncbi:hypothetical protein [Chryseosolibacter indicus]|uniref:Uncharacterized protein n=1 Tax=Chryseosolibacter indicus TaxID=2782351 RepID=A0ABS5VYR5_9BACT|nr:hypothetical protein [Chryseosolibacter indicus]MBT1706545.1 hypothetical protein [Chryseosolibacter indicus]
MNEFLNLTIKVITIDLFIGYGLFTLVWLRTSIIKGQSGPIETLDIKASKFIRFVGVIYFICIVTIIIISLVTVDDYEIRWYPLLQVVVWTTMTQFIMIEKVRRNKIVRLVFAILFLISFEIFVIVVTSIHRDYSSGGLFSELSTIDVIIGLTSKTVVFCILTMVYSFVIGQVKRMRAV